jgi:alkyl hydroperoxide reductase subunit AhpC
MVKIGQTAPDFSLESTQGQISLKKYLGKWVLLFFYPLDFTPV